MYEHLPRSNSTDSDLEPLFIEGEEVRYHHRRIRNFLAGIFVAVFGVALVIGLIFAAKYGGATGNSMRPLVPAPVVNTTCGWVVGLKEDDVYVYRGIPYAAPPVGKLRWKPPQDLAAENQCWDGTYRALNYGPSCVQLNVHTKRREGSENCLFVNIWTPKVGSQENLPVMVYIHGGYLLYGSGHDPDAICSGDIAKEGNLVMVSFNYRLNAFGFLALELLSQHSGKGTSGNYGFMDQIQALSWVQSNIRNFGGNPDQVTVYGLGSGGTSVIGLLASPLANGLFHRAWSLSASPWWKNATLNAVEKDNNLFLNKTRCDGIHCVFNLSVDKIIDAFSFMRFPAWDSKLYMDLPVKDLTFGALAVVDGYLIPKVPLDGWKVGIKNDVPLLIGNVAQETDYMVSPHGLPDWGWDDYETYVRTKLNMFDVDITDEALRKYKHEGSPEMQLTSMVSDMRVICPTNKLAKEAAKYFTSPVYRYVVSAAPSATVVNRDQRSSYAYHGWDLAAFFGRLDKVLTHPTQKDLKFASNLRRTVFDFVKNGRIKKWKEVPHQMTVFTSQIEFRDEYEPQKCDLWMSNGFYPNYTWFN